MTAELGLRRVPSLSRREHVVEILRDAIISGQLQPGHQLVERELAEQLGTSRAPVREALRHLEQEGLVITYPYRGTEVLGVSQEEIERVLVPIRLTLERFAFEKALPLLTDDDFATLEALVAEMRQGSAAGDVDRVAVADIRFHQHIIAQSDMPHCLQIWQTIQPRVYAYFRRDTPAHETPDYVADEHQQLLDTLRSSDEQQVLATLEEHIHAHLIFESGSTDDS